MKMPEESEEEMIARNKADGHKDNCEKLLGRRALYVASEFAPYIRAVLIALPPDVVEKLMDLKVVFLAVEKSIPGLTLDSPSTLHSHPISDSEPYLHSHAGGKLLYFSPLLFDKPQEHIRFTIAHEIAHAVLDHREDISSEAEAKRQEREADEQVEQWGFKRPPTVQPA